VLDGSERRIHAARPLVLSSSGGMSRGVPHSTEMQRRRVEAFLRGA
jgi:hypothetical protein